MARIGQDVPANTVILTFDDGQYGAPSSATADMTLTIAQYLNRRVSYRDRHQSVGGVPRPAARPRKWQARNVLGANAKGSRVALSLPRRSIHINQPYVNAPAEVADPSTACASSTPHDSARVLHRT